MKSKKASKSNAKLEKQNMLKIRETEKQDENKKLIEFLNKDLKKLNTLFSEILNRATNTNNKINPIVTNYFSTKDAKIIRLKMIIKNYEKEQQKLVKDNQNYLKDFNSKMMNIINDAQSDINKISKIKNETKDDTIKNTIDEFEKNMIENYIDIFVNNIQVLNNDYNEEQFKNELKDKKFIEDEVMKDKLLEIYKYYSDVYLMNGMGNPEFRENKDDMLKRMGELHKQNINLNYNNFSKGLKGVKIEEKKALKEERKKAFEEKREQQLTIIKSERDAQFRRQKISDDLYKLLITVNNM